MQILLKDIELGVQELECLIQSMSTSTNPVLKIAAKRSIYQMKERLDVLAALLGATLVITPAKQSAPTVAKTGLEHKTVADLAKEVPAKTVFIQDNEVPAPQTLTERIKPTIDLCHAISLNDSSRFTRELFNGNTTRMNKIVGQSGKAPLLEGAMSVFMSEVQSNGEDEAATDSIELFKKYFS